MHLHRHSPARMGKVILASTMNKIARKYRGSVMIVGLWQRLCCSMSAPPIFFQKYVPVAQLDRASASGAEG